MIVYRVSCENLGMRHTYFGTKKEAWQALREAGIKRSSTDYEFEKFDLKTKRDIISEINFCGELNN